MVPQRRGHVSRRRGDGNRHDRLMVKPKMSRRVPLLTAIALAGCAPVGPAPDSQTSAANAMQAAMQSQPPEEPTALPALRPATRLQSELEALTDAEIARWILPPD